MLCDSSGDRKHISETIRSAFHKPLFRCSMLSVSNECPQEREATHTFRLTHYGSTKICFALFNHLSLYTQIILWIGVYILPAHMYLLCERAMPAETSRGWQILWSWDYRWLWADMWALSTEPRSSARTECALNWWAISPASRKRILLTPLKLTCAFARNSLPLSHR